MTEQERKTFGGTSSTSGERKGDFDVLRVGQNDFIYVSILAGARAKYTHFLPVKYKTAEDEIRELRLPIVCGGLGCTACALAKLEKNIVGGDNSFNLQLKSSQTYLYSVIDRTEQIKAAKESRIFDGEIKVIPMELNTSLHKILQSLLNDTDAPWFGKPGRESDFVFKISKMKAAKADGYRKWDYVVVRLEEQALSDEDMDAITVFAEGNDSKAPNGSINLTKHLDSLATAPDDVLSVFKEGKFIFDINNSSLGVFRSQLALQLAALEIPTDIKALGTFEGGTVTQSELPGEIESSAENANLGGVFGTSQDSDEDEGLPFE